MGVVFFLAWIGLVIWVGWDASRLGVRKGCRGGGFLDMGVVAWICCCLLFWLVGLIAYVIARPKYVSLRRQFPLGDLPDLRGAGQWGPAAAAVWGGVPAYGVPPANPYAAPQAWAPPANPYSAPQAWAQQTTPYAAPQPQNPGGAWPQANPYAPPTDNGGTAPTYFAPAPQFGGRTCPWCAAPGAGDVCARCGGRTV